ncbi:DUF2185 domain-containing protein [Saccharospirillum salsuginis]|uniref:Immunity protein Imm33 domain-containing protein n=1 Tax=Saccharospirillum salsuginis TaxID=418750 RepID=A0A918JZU7_9GAMM|nr:DUF2185 domain-containing protein [Saccharospirillum salsuginis]GGX38295.1 hypothetical protein GCM10007392_00550 [Saccharospirillum salsuginis]
MQEQVSYHRHQGHLCLASSLILNERPLPIRFFYKEEAQHANDTGFRFYSGFETDDFLMEEDAACVAPLDCMERLDPSIVDLVQRSEVGSVWERLPDSNDWVPVYDYEIPD